MQPIHNYINEQCLLVLLSQSVVSNKTNANEVCICGWGKEKEGGEGGGRGTDYSVQTKLGPLYIPSVPMCSQTNRAMC